MAASKIKTSPQKGFTSWKLDTMKAVRADTNTSIQASAIFDAFMGHVNEKTLTAFVSRNTLALECCLNVKTIDKHFPCLISAGWLERIGVTARGTKCYKVLSHRSDGVLDSLTLKIDKHREGEKVRASRRRRQRKEQKVKPDGWSPINVLSDHMGGQVAIQTSGREHLTLTPSIICNERNESQESEVDENDDCLAPAVLRLRTNLSRASFPPKVITAAEYRAQAEGWDCTDADAYIAELNERGAVVS